MSNNYILIDEIRKKEYENQNLRKTLKNLIDERNQLKKDVNNLNNQIYNLNATFEKEFNHIEETAQKRISDLNTQIEYLAKENLILKQRIGESEGVKNSFQDTVEYKLNKYKNQNLNLLEEITNKDNLLTTFQEYYHQLNGVTGLENLELNYENCPYEEYIEKLKIIHEKVLRLLNYEETNPKFKDKISLKKAKTFKSATGEFNGNLLTQEKPKIPSNISISNNSSNKKISFKGDNMTRTPPRDKEYTSPYGNEGYYLNEVKDDHNCSGEEYY